MKYQIVKMDRSHPLVSPEPYCKYEYAIEFKLMQGGGMLYFHDVRKWLINGYGWSDQIGNSVGNVDNEYWGWTVNHNSYRIYLRSDRELMMFKLKFPMETTAYEHW